MKAAVARENKRLVDDVLPVKDACVRCMCLLFAVAHGLNAIFACVGGMGADEMSRATRPLPTAPVRMSAGGNIVFGKETTLKRKRVSATAYVS